MRKVTLSLFLTIMLVRGNCPTPTVPYSWSTTSVSYAMDSNTQAPCWTGDSFDPNDINAAFNQWTYADQNQNSTNTGFYFSPGGVPFNVHANRVVDPSGCGTSVAAQTYIAVFSQALTS